jgi:hypothetical protein
VGDALHARLVALRLLDPRDDVATEARGLTLEGRERACFFQRVAQVQGNRDLARPGVEAQRDLHAVPGRDAGFAPDVAVQVDLVGAAAARVERGLELRGAVHRGHDGDVALAGRVERATDGGRDVHDVHDPLADHVGRERVRLLRRHGGMIEHRRSRRTQ